MSDDNQILWQGRGQIVDVIPDDAPKLFGDAPDMQVSESKKKRKFTVSYYENAATADVVCECGAVFKATISDVGIAMFPTHECDAD